MSNALFPAEQAVGKAEAQDIERRTPPVSEKPTWDLAFIGVISYLVIEYTRLPAMFPFLRGFQIGKLAIGLGVVGLLTSEYVKERSARFLNIAVVGFILATLFSSIVAQNSSIALTAFIDVMQWGTIFFLVSRVVNNQKRLRIFLLILIILNMKLAQHAVRSYATFAKGSYEQELLSSRGVGGGSTGFFGNPGDFGVAMCTIWPLTGVVAFGEKKKIAKYMLIACWVVILLAIILCGSRGALLGAAVATLIAVFRHPSRVSALAILVVFTAAVIFILPDANKARFQSGMTPGKDKTASIRLTLWTNGIRMFEDNPVFGVGLANFPTVYKSKYAPPGNAYADQAWVPHSIYVQALSELGLFGTLPLLVLWFACFRTNYQTRKLVKSYGGDSTSFAYRLASGLDLALVGYLVSGAFLTVLYYPHLWILSGLTAGLYSGCSVQDNPATISSSI